MSAPAETASMNALVPDLAMVPKLFISSDLVMPMPVSHIVSVLLVLSGIILISRFGSVSSYSGSVIDLYLILSRASEELEMSSLKNISLWE